MGHTQSYMILLLLTASLASYAQEGTAQQQLQKISPKYIDDVSRKSEKISEKLNKKSEKALRDFQKQEAKLQKKISKVDSVAAHNMLVSSEQRYKELEQKLEHPGKLTKYIPFLDSTSTSLGFLNQNNGFLKNARDAKQKINDAIKNADALKAEFQKAEDIKSFLKEREQYLKEQLKKLNLTSQLKQLTKQVYYYAEQVNQYKDVFTNPDKAEKLALGILNKTKFFQEFMRKNSMLTQLFHFPDPNTDPLAYTAALSGLQTRAQISDMIQQQLSAGGPNAMANFQQNMQAAQGQLSQLKNKILSLGGNSSSMEIPEGFKPNTQKLKSFKQRLEFGTNIQTQQSTNYFPVSSDVALSVGYKLNDKSTIGIGASYKLGWGTGFNNIHLTSQGVGLRSFVDIKAPFGGSKSAWSISGGYEQNYKQQLNGLYIPSPFGGGRLGASWQQSGLIGLSKTVPINTKFFKATKVMLLWDFLSYDQLPKTQPVVFRVGYKF